jgi:pimeloyl-ACP methyl ester carboxylesterase
MSNLIDSSCAVALPVQRWGVGNSRFALLVHGVAANGGGWWRVAEGLAAHGFEVWAPDLRGHGNAPVCSSYLFDDFAKDLAELRPSWDLVIGHSLGGPIVCALLGRSVLSARTVLVEPVFEIPPDHFEDVVLDQISEADPFADPTVIADDHPTWHPVDAHQKALAARAVAAWTVEQTMRSNSPWNHRRLSSVLSMPTVVLGGDPAVFTMCPAELGNSIVASLPQAQFNVVTGAGHGIHRDNPSAIVAAAIV